DDISDGLASEANEIAKASQIGIRLHADSIPLSPELTAASARLGKPALDYALYGGEDFQLLFTMAPDKYQALLAAHPELPVIKVGQVVGQAEGVTLVDQAGRAHRLEPRGFNHFRQEE
ncbi:MAG: thiamine-phosphate kinase, partial [Sporomusa sp.]